MARLTGAGCCARITTGSTCVRAEGVYRLVEGERGIVVTRKDVNEIQLGKGGHPLRGGSAAAAGGYARR